MILNGIERFWIEKVRINNPFIEFGNVVWTQAELIAVIMFFVGILGVLFFEEKTKLNY